MSAQLFGQPAPRQPDYSQQSGDDDADQGMQIERLQSQLRKLTGQNEELQFRNRQLEEQLRQLQAGAPPAGARPNVAAAPVQAAPVQAAPARQQPLQPQVYDPQPPVAAAAPVVQDPAPPQRGGRRNDAFDPNANPNAPGVPRALGGGGQPIPSTAPAATPNARGAGEPLPLGIAAPASSGGGLTTLPPGATPKDEFDLGIGYMQRRDYALAEETMRNFAQ
ncbi:MAG: tol-pal system protein YbgF, partial [Tardiphaga sp.]|nr:tol-pal system protein YbgF [Tardiphaga sp.]